MMKFKCALILGVIGLAAAMTEDEKAVLRATVIPVVAECGSKLGISNEEMLAAKQANNADALNPCLYACFFKKMGNIINDQGLYDVSVDNQIHRKYFHDANDLKKLDEITRICSSVNDQDVTDGTKGCERAKLLIHCLRDNKSIINSFLY